MFDIRKIQEAALSNAVSAASDAATAADIVRGERGTSVAEDNATWVKSAMARLENRFDRDTVRQIRMNCQCGYGLDERYRLVRDLVAASSNMQAFAEREEAVAAGLSCRDGVLHLSFPFCPCPMLADVDRLPTDTWCQCTTGYSKVLFEKAFGCTVDVELLQSVKMGDAACLMKIMPREPVWK